MLNKRSEKWAKAPLLVKIGLLSISSRKTALAYEIGSAVLAVMSVVGGVFFAPLLAGAFLFAASYWYAVSIRWVDNAGLWTENT